METFEKLVRDGIPDIIRGKGEEPVTRRVEGAEYLELLRAKLREEMEELLAAETPDARLEETADVLEVLAALAKHDGTTLDAAQKKQEAKRQARGGFDDGVVLTMSK